MSILQTDWLHRVFLIVTSDLTNREAEKCAQRNQGHHHWCVRLAEHTESDNDSDSQVMNFQSKVKIKFKDKVDVPALW